MLKVSHFSLHLLYITTGRLAGVELTYEWRVATDVNVLMHFLLLIILQSGKPRLADTTGAQPQGAHKRQHLQGMAVETLTSSIRCKAFFFACCNSLLCTNHTQIYVNGPFT